MTRTRIHGNDVPFAAWMRRHENLDSRRDWFVATDYDFCIHQYKTVVDAVGTREVQAMMFLEVKRTSDKLHDSQADTLFKNHVMAEGTKKLDNGQTLFHYGVSLVWHDGYDPSESTVIRWGRFEQDGSIRGKDIDESTLVSLLKFELHPKTLTNNPFRRHHKTREIMVVEQRPLFPVEKPVVYRS